MKAYELPTRITHEGRLDVPDSFLRQLPDDQPLRLIVLAPEPSDTRDDHAWTRLTTDQFLAGYGEADSIYDSDSGVRRI